MGPQSQRVLDRTHTDSGQRLNKIYQSPQKNPVKSYKDIWKLKKMCYFINPFQLKIT